MKFIYPLFFVNVLAMNIEYEYFMRFYRPALVAFIGMDSQVTRCGFNAFLSALVVTANIFVSLYKKNR